MGVGRRLRQAREARGLSMTEVAASTKIPVRQLAALEAEEYETLPGGIFVRGHIRAAAKAVGLDPADADGALSGGDETLRRSRRVPRDAELAEDHGPRCAWPRSRRTRQAEGAPAWLPSSFCCQSSWRSPGSGATVTRRPSSRKMEARRPRQPRWRLRPGTPPKIDEPQGVGTIGTMPDGRSRGRCAGAAQSPAGLLACAHRGWSPDRVPDAAGRRDGHGAHAAARRRADR